MSLNGKPLLSAQDLVKRYNGRPVVDRLSYHVHAGEIVGLLGRNGAGKTTTFRMTVGMIDPDGGQVDQLHHHLRQPQRHGGILVRVGQRSRRRRPEHGLRRRGSVSATI